jgi:hypothetical protein
MATFPADSPSSSLTNDILLAILHGGVCVGYQNLAFDDAPVVVLTVPAGAQYAICVLEADATEVDFPRVARFREDGVAPTAAEGMPVGDNGSFEIRGAANLAAFQIIGITAGKNHTLKVQYYGAG